MGIRAYNPGKDKQAVLRIYRELDWLKNEKKEEQAIDWFFRCSKVNIHDVNGSAECVIAIIPARVQYSNDSKNNLRFSAIASMATSLIIRQRRIAGKLLAYSIAEDVQKGAQVAGLCMFEQGFYDRLGFGTGSYENRVCFDPANLNISIKPRIPVRITDKDWKQAHECTLNRKTFHGGVNLLPSLITRVRMAFTKNGFGFGYKEKGRITHYMWIQTDNIESGPYNIQWMSYNTGEQFLELLALIKSWGDQIRLVEIEEPVHIQFQDFLCKPFYYSQITEKAKYENKITAAAYWQMRICLLQDCITAVKTGGVGVEFNLRLYDPIKEYLPQDSKWQGCSGDYVVKFGSESVIRPGKKNGLPVLEASIGAFTRMWLGVRPASGLAISDNLKAPDSLLEGLDIVFLLPRPSPDCDY